MKTSHKKLLTTLIALMSVGYACNEKNIDLDPLAVTEAAYFKEEIDFDRSVLAIYAKLTDFYWFNGNNPIHGFWQLPGDDITTTGTEAYEIFGTLQPATGFLGDYYRTSYQLINRANTTLQKIEAEKGVYKTPNLKNYHKGEALFLRGMIYFNLSNFFGTSPLVVKRIEGTEEIAQPSSAEGALLDQAVKDFTEAATLLPAVWDAGNRGRATSNSANGFLGKSLIFRASIKKQDADYAAALTALNKVTGALAKDFGSNFDVKDENNAESVFEFQATQPGGGDNVWLSNDFDNNIGSTSAYWGYYENHYSLFGKAPYVGTKKLLAAFDPQDPRLPLTMDAKTRAITKYVTRDQKTQSGVGSLNNARILRYADILLLKAEATLLSNGSTADAIGFINQVRTRARTMVAAGTIPANFATAEADKAKIMGWIMNERFVELAGEEGIRWLDLRRWHLNGRINLGAGFDFSSDRTDVSISIPKNLYYPIPLNEIDLNPNVKQNTGY
ncbi:RagB/SusD family nutrient uptake outer membrane protein [Runella zeae]|uniref:RagB/SusD family nutrient uptake outer membrane protein n=1 Tax=Runella zeae TaxID=94255 RepID=UPI000411D7E5|nr:RagB/SusD family nutrient uptake outer membrane protein [Runella zeae]